MKNCHLKCVDCEKVYSSLDVRYRCDCGGTLDLIHDLLSLKNRISTGAFDKRRSGASLIDRSGVWRFRELILPVEAEHIAAKPEGNTNLYDVPRIAEYAGLKKVALKHEGENPTGSFKDRGMTVGVTMARRLGMDRVACASTGNTSASLASYAASAGMEALIFTPAGYIAAGKLCQALAYGARNIQIEGDFDAAMTLVQEVCREEGIYLLNSINPFRVEGQKAIAFELLQDRGWKVPDWIVLPGGNLGNSSAIGKGLMEMKELGLIDRLPKIGVIQAAGANPFYTAFVNKADLVPVEGAETIATAIRIGNPVSWKKSLRAVKASGGVVAEVTDQDILDAKAQVDAAGIGAEPASCATVAGMKQLVEKGVIDPGEDVCGILTGHLLKDPDVVIHYHQDNLKGITPAFPNPPVKTKPTLKAVLDALKK